MEPDDISMKLNAYLLCDGIRSLAVALGSGHSYLIKKIVRKQQKHIALNLGEKGDID